MAKHLNINSMLLETDKESKYASISTNEIGLDRDEAYSLYRLYVYYKKIVQFGEKYKELLDSIEEKGTLYKFIAALARKIGNIRNKQTTVLSSKNKRIIELVFRGAVTKTTFNMPAWLDKCGEIYGIQKEVVDKMKEYYDQVTNSKNPDYDKFRKQGATSDPYFNLNPDRSIPKINTSVKLNKDQVDSIFGNLDEEASYETFGLFREIMDLLDRYERALDQLDAIITPVLSGDVQMAAESKMPTLKSVVEHYLKK